VATATNTQAAKGSWRTDEPKRTKTVATLKRVDECSTFCNRQSSDKFSNFGKWQVDGYLRRVGIKRPTARKAQRLAPSAICRQATEDARPPRDRLHLQNPHHTSVAAATRHVHKGCHPPQERRSQDKQATANRPQSALISALKHSTSGENQRNWRRTRAKGVKKQHFVTIKLSASVQEAAEEE